MATAPTLWAPSRGFGSSGRLRLPCPGPAGGPQRSPEASKSMPADDLVEFVKRELTMRANPSAAGPMARYMKTDMPFYGIKCPQREPVIREMVRRFPPGDETDVELGVLALWALPHREEKYAALAYAASAPKGIGLLPLYERLIREGGWWDLVDEVAIKLVGKVLLDEPD